MKRGKRLTLAEERELRLALIDGLSRGLFSRVGGHVGVAHRDQVEAATAEVRKQVRRLVGTPPYVFSVETDSRAGKVEIAAAVFRCMAQHRCEHALVGDRPLTAVLAARVVACDRCRPRYQGALAAARLQIENGVDRLCDLCLKEPPDNQFRPVLCHFGPVRVSGHACERCFDVLAADGTAEEAAA